MGFLMVLLSVALTGCASTADADVVLETDLTPLTNSERMNIEGALDAGVAITFDGQDNPISGDITGLVADHATRIAVTFTSGDTADITPGETVQLGVKGFGLNFDAAQLGEPTTIEVFAGDESLGVYDHSVGLPRD